jgi:putative acetyltransferase
MAERIASLAVTSARFTRSDRASVGFMTFSIRPIQHGDDPGVAALIRSVMPEFGAEGPGFAITDPEVDAMSRAYAGERAGYWVIDREGRVVGGGGFAQLVGASDDVCELRKMYFYAETRGRGLGRELLETILGRARAVGFRICYLETLASMHQARKLYEANGFARIDSAMGQTGHFGCNTYYARSL